MTTILRRAGWLVRAIAGQPPSPATPPAGPRVLPAYAALARYRTSAVATMHFFNPITGALGADVQPCVPPLRPATGGPSSIRNLWL